MILHLNLLPARIRRERTREWWGSVLITTGLLSLLAGNVAATHDVWLDGWTKVLLVYGYVSMPGCIFFTNKRPDRNANLH